MIWKIDSYVKSYLEDVLEKLCVEEFVGEFIKVGPDNSVVKVPRRIHNALRVLLWGSVCYDKNIRKEY